MSHERLKCPECSMPTIPDKGIQYMQYEEFLCDSCYEDFEKNLNSAQNILQDMERMTP